MSGLDWLPTFVAAAGNANIVEELKAGKSIGGTTYKVHLDGYNQMDMLTGKGPVTAKRSSTLANRPSVPCASATGSTVFIDQPDGWPGDKNKLNVPYRSQPAP